MVEKVAIIGELHVVLEQNKIYVHIFKPNLTMLWMLMLNENLIFSKSIACILFNTSWFMQQK